MLTNRQLRILQYLLEKSYSGADLARLLETSRRTIIRDIAMLDEWLVNNDYGQINNSKHYSLVVVDAVRIQSELQKLQFQKYRVLYLLLTHYSVTLDELADSLLMRKKEIDETIRTINKEYQSLLVIEKKVSKGVFLNITDYERINLLASLLFSHSKLVSNQMVRLIKQVQRYLEENSDDSQVSTILLFETGQQLGLQRLSFLICQQASLIEVEFNDYLEQKLCRIDKIQNFNLAKVLTKMNQINKLSLEIGTCAKMIMQHLQRTISFPSYFEINVDNQFKTLKIEYPFIFEVASILSLEMQNFLDVLYIDSQYIALYMINAQQISQSLVSIIMYEERHSISSINEKLLSDQIKNINLQVAHSVDDLARMINQDMVTILIVDRSQLTKLIKYETDYIFDGLINNDDLVKIQNLVGTKIISQEITNEFQNRNFLTVSSQLDFATTLASGLKQLVALGEVTQRQVNAIKERELAGNQLIIGHLSIPHIKADITEPFKLCYLKLDTSVKLQNNVVDAMLIVLVSTFSNEYTQLFSYLYTQFKDVDVKMIQNQKNLLDVLNRNEN